MLNDIEFKKTSLDYAYKNKEDIKYNYLIHKHNYDNDMLNYINLELTKSADIYQITIFIRNDIHPEYDNLVYAIISNEYNRSKGKRKNIKKINKNFFYIKDIGQTTIDIIILLEPNEKYNHLLDIELKKTILINDYIS